MEPALFFPAQSHNSLTFLKNCPGPPGQSFFCHPLWYHFKLSTKYAFWLGNQLYTLWPPNFLLLLVLIHPCGSDIPGTGQNMDKLHNDYARAAGCTNTFISSHITGGLCTD